MGQEQETNMRRRTEENNLFMQAQELNSMLDQQEAGLNNRGPGGPGGPRGGPGPDSSWGQMGGGQGPAWDDRGNMDNGPFGNNQGGGFNGPRGHGGPRGG